MSTDLPTSTDQFRWRSVLFIGITLLLLFLLYSETPHLNGSPYWVWSYRLMDSARTWGVLLAACVPFLAGRWLVNRGFPARYALVAIAGSTLTVQLGAIGLMDWPFGLGEVIDIIRSDAATSYYTDAANLVMHDTPIKEFLGTFPDRMPMLGGHNRNKPAGLTLFHWIFVKAFGETPTAALTAGVAIGILASMTGPLTYWMLRRLSATPIASWEAACFAAISPGMVLIFPEFDQTFAPLTCLMIGTWATAVTRQSKRWAVAFGVVLAATLFFTFNLLVLGVFLAGYALAQKRPLSGIFQLSTIAIATFALLYAAAWIFTGYNVVATFTQAVHMQRINLEGLPRPWPQTIPWDLNEFALTTGWLGYLVLVAQWIRATRSRTNMTLVVLVTLQLLATACSGLLQAEAARLWLFLVPVLSIVVGFELERWSRTERLIFHMCRIVLLAAICQKIQFIIV